jgi:GNAT superfamily N-acetyltransferase
MSFNASSFRPWAKFWRMLKELGPAYTFQQVLGHFVPHSLFHAGGFVVVAWDLRQSPPRREPGAGIRPARRKDCEALAQQLGPSSTELLRRFERGAHVWIVERDGRPVACNWVRSAKSWYKFDWLALEKEPTDMFALEIKVAHGYRRHGFAGLLRRHVASRCLRAGCTRMVGTIDTGNRNALLAADKVGYRRIGRVFVLRIVGLGLVRYAGTVHVGRWSAPRPLSIPLEIFDRPKQN